MSDRRRRAAAHVLVEPGSLVDGGAVSIDDEVEHHLRRVVRLADGAEVTVTDGAGRWVPCRVLHDRRLRLDPAGGVEVEPRPAAVRLATAIPKGDRIEWLVQKATELGVERITLLHAQRSVVRWGPDRAERQLARLGRIADEALRQSRRVWRTEIDGPVDAAQVLPAAVVSEPGGRALEASDDLVAIGPEGGWTDAELEVARDRIGLGATVLRTETAVVAAAVLAAAARR